MLEQADPRPECRACLLPQGLEQVACSVHCESQEVQDRQHAGQGFLSMAEIVLEVVAISLENVVALVRAFPSGAACPLVIYQLGTKSVEGTVVPDPGRPLQCLRP